MNQYKINWLPVLVIVFLAGVLVVFIVNPFQYLLSPSSPTTDQSETVTPEEDESDEFLDDSSDEVDEEEDEDVPIIQDDVEEEPNSSTTNSCDVTLPVPTGYTQENTNAYRQYFGGGTQGVRIFKKTVDGNGVAKELLIECVPVSETNTLQDVEAYLRNNIRQQYTYETVGSTTIDGQPANEINFTFSSAGLGEPSEKVFVTMDKGAKKGYAIRLVSNQGSIDDLKALLDEIMLN